MQNHHISTPMLFYMLWGDFLKIMCSVCKKMESLSYSVQTQSLIEFVS